MVGNYYSNHISALVDKMHNTFETHEVTGFKLTFARIYVYIFGIPEIGVNLRLWNFQKTLKKYSENKIEYILDGGCGLGIFSLYLAGRFPSAKIDSCDLNSSYIKTNQEILSTLKYSNLHFFKKDLLEPFEKEKYDLITCIDVLEHIDNISQVIQNFSKSLRNNGLLFIHVPNKNQKVYFKSVEDWASKYHDIRIGFEENELKNLLEENGFSVVESITTFGFLGSISRQLNQVFMDNFLLAGITFPLLLLIARLDTLFIHRNGAGILIVAKK